MSLVIANKAFSSRLFTGTGKFGSLQIMHDALKESETELITVALKRVNLKQKNDSFLKYLNLKNVSLLPNTAGTHTAQEAIFASELAREALETNWIKLEIHPDQKYLLPDPIETLKAAEILVKKGFVVLPYIHADPVLCKRLEEVGVATVMPLGSPIGSNRGLKTKAMLEIIIEQSTVPVIIDAGIGSPSDATKAMEMGADAVLVNTAIAVAKEPIQMANAFKLSVQSGRIAYEAGLGNTSKIAVQTSETSLAHFLDSIE